MSNNYPFHDIALTNSFEGVDVVRLIESGADINDRNDEGKTCLNIAASKNHLEVFEFLIKNGAQINIQSGVKNTPLHGAAYYGHQAIVKSLIEKKC
jgi:ankyrin repeat protein